MIRVTLTASMVLLLVHIASYTDLFSQVTRPSVVAILNTIGINSLNHENEIEIAHLRLPWSRDCSGINGLILLWILTLWSNRHQPFGWPFVWKMIRCLPAALAANIIRILLLATYRHIFFPDQETPELHYFIGFLCLLPFVYFFNADFGRSSFHNRIEILHLAVVMAVLIPSSFSPGGWLIVAATLSLLARTHRTGFSGRTLRVANVSWVCVGLFIGLAQMDFLWLPWLLLTPRFGCFPCILSVSGFITLSSTLSVFAMHGEWQAVAVLAMLYQFVSKAPEKRFTEKHFPSLPPLKPLEVAVHVLVIV